MEGMTKIISIVLINVFLIACSSIGTYSMETGITIDDALVIGKSDATKLGYDVYMMDIEIIDNDLPWFMYYPMRKVYTSGYVNKLREEIGNEEYWAIYLKPSGSQEEIGDVCLFISKNAGKIIAVYEGDKL